MAYEQKPITRDTMESAMKIVSASEGNTYGEVIDKLDKAGLSWGPDDVRDFRKQTGAIDFPRDYASNRGDVAYAADILVGMRELAINYNTRNRQIPMVDFAKDWLENSAKARERGDDTASPAKLVDDCNRYVDENPSLSDKLSQVPGIGRFIRSHKMPVPEVNESTSSGRRLPDISNIKGGSEDDMSFDIR